MTPALRWARNSDQRTQARSLRAVDFLRHLALRGHECRITLRKSKRAELFVVLYVRLHQSKNI